MLLNDEGFELFGGAGRAYDRNLFDYVQLETTKATYPTYEYRFLAPGVPGACDTPSAPIASLGIINTTPPIISMLWLIAMAQGANCICCRMN